MIEISHQSPQDLLLKADALALSFRHYTGNYKQISRDNTYWQYRPYEGGEPATMIDWRQSGRSETLYVRERTKVEKQTAFLWADNSSSMTDSSFKEHLTYAQEAKILLFALSRLLIQENRKIIWASPLKPSCTTESRLDDFVAQIESDTKTNSKTPPPFMPPAHSVQVYASNFLSDVNDWHSLFFHAAEKNTHGILLCLSSDQSLNDQASAIKNTAHKFGWHFITHKPDLLPQETLSKIMTALCDTQSA